MSYCLPGFAFRVIFDVLVFFRVLLGITFSRLLFGKSKTRKWLLIGSAPIQRSPEDLVSSKNLAATSKGCFLEALKHI